MSDRNYHLVPKKYHYMLEEVADNHGVVEVVLKRPFEYTNGASMACYERDERDWCKVDGSRSDFLLKRYIGYELEATIKVDPAEWDKNHK